ncbi:uncharacterized protein LOC144745728 [Ciona intestinalis]
MVKGCFRKYGRFVCEARRAGDKNPTLAVQADCAKLLGNSAYGKTLTNKLRFKDVLYKREVDLTRYAKRMTYIHTEPIFEDLYELNLAKVEIIQDLPMQIAIFVYSYAKLRMLEPVYDLLFKFISHADISLVQTDTDSMYYGLFSNSIEDVIKPELRTQFFTEYNSWFPALACDKHNAEFIQTKSEYREWVPQECCKERTLYDKRTLGLFKLEYSGNAIVALNSKTYFCHGDIEKISSKGLSKKQNNLTFDDFANVLKTKQSVSGENVSFRVCDNHVFTTKQTKVGLSYFYPKRKVQPDGIHTLPLDI